jgi:hypothetical protein
VETALEVRVTLNADMSLGEALALETALRSSEDAVLEPLRRAINLQLVAAQSVITMRAFA